VSASARRTLLGGLGLVELLVAITLVSTLAAGGLAAFARANAAWRVQVADQRRLERAQFVFSTLEPDLQMAGYFDGALPSPLPAATIPASVQACGAQIVSRLDVPVERLESLPSACVARSVLDTDSDVLVVRRASAQLAMPRPGRAQWSTAGDAAGGNALSWDGQTPPEAPNATLRDLILRIFYVARGADGDPSLPALRVKSLTEVGGRPAFVDTEVMPGVESLEVDLLPPAAPRSIQLRLRIRADAADAGARDAGRTLSVTRRFTLRNAPDAR
jgi:type II secretory pathway pseudopilin PulG